MGKKKNKKELSVDEEMMMWCAYRYAIGRKTYVPKAVIDFVTPLISDLPTLTLENIKKEIMLNYENSFLGDSDIDKSAWLNFLAKVKMEIDKRKEENG